MTQPWSDEQYAKVFLIVDADRRKCVVCEEVFTRLGSYKHSKSICHPPAPKPNQRPSIGRDRMNQRRTTVTNFQFRLKGVFITEIKVRPVLIDGTTDHWELVACHDSLGDFAIDDNQELGDPALTRFALEVRDVSISSIERRYLPNKGWRQVTTKECITLLESAGVIEF